MDQFNPDLLKQLYIPCSESHKGQNGKLLIIGGSHLFHAASLWSLEVVSRIVDMVFYSSVPENNEIVQKAKEEFRNGIIVERKDLEHYIQEADCILIGPGMVRSDKFQISSIRQAQDKNFKYQINTNIQNINEINQVEDEGEQTFYFTKYLLEKYPDKKWVIDAGSLQMMEPEWLLGLKQIPILTPHKKEFETLFGNESGIMNHESKENKVSEMAKKYNSVILFKGEEDTICSPEKCMKVLGGNAGMTKGGTGDVLAGLVAALYCKNDAFLSATCASYINKKAGDALFKRVGYYFNASDLANEIPQVMRELLV